MVRWIKSELGERYKITDISIMPKLLSLDIKQSDDNKCITIGLGEIVREMLYEAELEGLNPCTTPVQPNLTQTVADYLSETSSDTDTVLMRRVNYRQAIGCLLWIANETRPYIAVAVSHVLLRLTMSHTLPGGYS